MPVNDKSKILAFFLENQAKQNPL